MLPSPGLHTAMTGQQDAFVVGGGPAGLAAALALRQKGFRVSVADGARLPIDKVCGEGILPEGVAVLRQLDVDISPEEGFHFRGLRFVSGSESAEARFSTPYGLGIRRTFLHRRMMEAARKAGITLHWGQPVTGLTNDGGVLLAGVIHRPRWIIAADGSFSRVRRWAGLESAGIRHRRFAFRRHYRIAPWSDFVEVHWGKFCQFYVTPLSNKEVGVVVLSSKPELRIEEALREFPSLSARLLGAPATTSERGGFTGHWVHRSVINHNVALVGDAAGIVDAISGEGLRLGFHQAFALADALAAGNPGRYAREHRRLMRRPRLMARLMLAMPSRPGLQQRVIRILSREPGLFQRMLAVHTGNSSPMLLASAGTQLSWKLLVEAF